MFCASHPKRCAQIYIYNNSSFFLITASIKTCVCFQERLFAARVVYDLLFFFLVIIIVLNLIFGVIIDTFADLRSEKQRKEEILKTTCFICGEMRHTSSQQSVILNHICAFTCDWVFIFWVIFLFTHRFGER